MKTQRHTIVAGNGREVKPADGENASFSHSYNPNNVFSQIFIFAFVRKHLDSNATLVCTAISPSVFPRFANGGSATHKTPLRYHLYHSYAAVYTTTKTIDVGVTTFNSSPPPPPPTMKEFRLSFQFTGTYYPSDNTYNRPRTLGIAL